MKTVKFFLIFFLFTNSLFAQSLSQTEFNKITSDIKETLWSVNKSQDFLELIIPFDLVKSDSVQMADLAQNIDIQFLKNMQAQSHILPFYFLTDNPYEIKLTLFSLTVEPQRKGEEFHRGDYHFVLTSIIKIEDENLTYKNSELITNTDSINHWFLKGYESYLEKTKVVFDKFGYTPPPPPLPPSTLK